MFYLTITLSRLDGSKILQRCSIINKYLVDNLEPMIFCFHRKLKLNLGFEAELPVRTGLSQSSLLSQK